ncbi:MAG: DUF1499 domain-containing protein [Pseudomonadales bacterium]
MLLSSKIQIGALVLAVLAMVGQKLGVLPFSLAFPGFGLGTLIVVVLGIVGLLALLWGLIKGNAENRGLKVRMMIIGLLPLAVIVGIVGPGLSAPPIHDITTDIDNPPEFVAAKAARVEGENSTDYDTGISAQQRDAFPALHAIEVAADQSAAFKRSLAVVEQLGWTLLDSDEASGRIEAYQETAMFGFIDDVVIRVQANDSGSRIDLRSNSRVGQGDLGANAARIQKFIDAYKN